MHPKNIALAALSQSEHNKGLFPLLGRVIGRDFLFPPPADILFPFAFVGQSPERSVRLLVTGRENAREGVVVQTEAGLRLHGGAARATQLWARPGPERIRDPQPCLLSPWSLGLMAMAELLDAAQVGLALLQCLNPGLGF